MKGIMDSKKYSYMHITDGILGEISAKPNTEATMSDCVRAVADANRHQLLSERDDTETFYSEDLCIHQLFESQVLKRSDSIGVVFEGHHLSYGELNHRSSQLAHYLIRLGVGPEIPVGICVDRSVEMIIGLLGILKAGGVYVPLDPSCPKDRLSFMLEDACIDVVLSQHKFLGIFFDFTATVICLDSDWELINVEITERPFSGITSENLAYIVYTSGSTGQPKGVLVSHDNVTHLFKSTDEYFEFSDCDIWTLFHSYGFDFSVWELWGALFYGGRLVLVPYETTRSPDKFYELLQNERVTVLNQTPSAFRILIGVEEGRHIASSHALRVVIFGGEALSPDILFGWFEYHSDSCQFVNMYGITETTVHTTYKQLFRDDLKLDSYSNIGNPIKNSQVYLLDNCLEPVPIIVVGEIYIGGRGVARGYLGRPDLTALRFLPDLFGGSGTRMYRSGDTGRYLSNGEIEYVGRIDDQVKIHGFRIELCEIETVLSRHPSICQAVVLAREDVPGEKRLLAYIVATEGQVLETNQLRGYLSKYLPDYMIPSLFMLLESFPLTPNGKLDRRALIALDLLRPKLSQGYVAPRTSTEQILSQICSDVLGIDKVGIYDNFFDLGFDSLLLVRVLYEAHSRGLKITIGNLIQHVTIADLAPFVEPINNMVNDYKLKRGSIPMLPSQYWLFERNLPDMENYNAAFLLKTMRGFSACVLDQAVRQLVLQHDAFRFHFQQTPKGYEQISEEPGKFVYFYQIDLTWLPKEHRNQFLPTLLKDLRRSLNLENGPIVRFVYLRLGPGMAGLLLIVVSHLIYDSVSSAILINDFSVAYRCLMEGNSPKLLPPTTSLKAWAEFLHKYAQSPEAKSELGVWLGQSWSLVRSLPMDISNDELVNTYESSDDLQVDLSKKDTNIFVGRLARAYDMSLGDILLAVLARCLGYWANTKVVLMDVTVNGRELLSSDIDPSRVVGYLTTVYPIVLDLSDSEVLDVLLLSIQRQLQKVPNHGIGYSILRYMCKDEQIQRELALLMQPQVKFNYSGQYSQCQEQVDGGLFDIMGIPFRFTKENIPGVLNGLDQRKYLLNFESSIQNGRLFFSIKYSRNIHRRETIVSLCDQYLNCLESLVRNFRFS